MEKLIFSHDWNRKLNGIFFTTIRRYNPKKYARGNRVEVYCKYGKAYHSFGVAEIVDVRKITLNDLNEYICGLDTGYSVEETKKIFRRMYKNNADSMSYSFVLLKYLTGEER